ncbi:TPA: UDP-N-acetylglucosamine 2-epimerase, partial [Campylobacter lari]|nr:UDP-N-acetylglucosamine 2-epimerase [Campylobacter lari]
NNERFKIFPSLRFEYFISLLKNANFIIGNSSCIIKEALYLNVNGILVGSRQNGREGNKDVLKVNAKSDEILKAIEQIYQKQNFCVSNLKILDSSKLFFEYLQSGKFFEINKQKTFKELKL